VLSAFVIITITTTAFAIITIMAIAQRSPEQGVERLVLTSARAGGGKGCAEEGSNLDKRPA